MLPFATREWGGASFSDALFTATSASCVTGLVVKDTATYWSLFGQIVILILIQIGGLGVMTMASAIIIMAGRRMGLGYRSILQNAVSANQVGGIVRMTKFIIKLTAAIEITGAVILSFTFIPEFGVAKGIWYSIFHSISAFCNAGFDLMGVKGAFSSLTSYAASPAVLIPIMLLIICGGIGFFTWEDIKLHGIHLKKYRMQSKVILVTYAVLIIIPAIFFFFTEYSDLPAGERVMNSFFQSITPRTAGFNSADLTALKPTGVVSTIVLMLIGGAPGSTAGGMKVTTIAVLLSLAAAVVTRNEHAHFFKRRVSLEIARNAATIFVIYLTLFLFSSIIIGVTDGLPMREVMFETGSAIGTVGLTMGITPVLSLGAHVILILLMLFGRVGGLTFMFAAFPQSLKRNFEYPEENINVG
ncbi:MAG: Trk family potassium uptake protein [Lachnospiraceae bacterium]|nr:Trk family potassium uptake protein [Lachnospiraceae bacterium]